MPRKDSIEITLPARPGPNRHKFASLVGKLDAHHVNFGRDVAALQAEFDDREERINQIVRDLTNRSKVSPSLIGGCDPALRTELNNTIRAAVERFVVDHF